MADTATEYAELLFTCAFDDEAFASLPQRLADLVGGRSCTLQFMGKQWEHFDFVWTHFNNDMFRDYVGEFRRDDIWISVGRTLALNRVQNMDRFHGYEQHLKSRIYNEFYRAHGDDTAHCLGSVMSSAAGYISLGIHRPHSRGAFDDDDEAILQPILPGLLRLHQARARLRTAEARADVTTRALDRLGFAAAVVRHDRRVVVCNLAAEELFRRPDGLSAAHMRLKASDSQDDKRLGEIIYRATAATPRQADAVMIRSQDGATQLRVMATPLPHGDQALLIIDDPERPARMTEMAARLYGLSPAETVLADAVLRGERPEDVAEARGVRLSTIRTQMSSLLQKTETSRQSQLAARLAGLPALRNPEK